MSKGLGEDGLTLVEVLASIVILTIILTSALLIFNQTMRANKESEHIVDATYVAQNEMEKLYHFSKEKHPILSPNDGYTFEGQDAAWDLYKSNQEESDYNVLIMKQETEDNMVRLVVKVIDESDRVKSQMESLLKWED